MAAAVGSNNIYPPVVSSFAPNFVIGSEKGCRVYFSISAYNSIGEYQDIHIYPRVHATQWTMSHICA